MEDLNKYNTEINFSLSQKIVEALIFSSAEPISYLDLKKIIIDKKLLDEILTALENKYVSSGVNLCTINNCYAFRTSSEVSEYLNIKRIVPKPLSRAATETLAIIAYHQPITRPEIENIRGVSLSRGTIDLLLELGWIQPGQRRATPGNPMTWKTSNNFLDHFGLKDINDLPGVEDLKNAGLLDKNKIIFSDKIIE